MFATAIALLLIGQDKDAPVLAVRPEPNHVIVVPAKPEFTKTTAEWKWYVFMDRMWSHRARPEDMVMPDPHKPLPRAKARPYTGDQMFDRPIKWDPKKFSVADSDEVEAGSVEVLVCRVKMEAKPLDGGAQAVQVTESSKSQIFKVGDPVDLDLTRATGQGRGVLIGPKNLRSLLKDFVTKKKTFDSPRWIELARFNFPNPKGAVKVLPKDGGLADKPVSVRYFDCPLMPTRPPKLTKKELDYQKEGYQVVSSSGGGIPNETIFVPYKS